MKLCFQCSGSNYDTVWTATTTPYNDLLQRMQFHFMPLFSSLSILIVFEIQGFPLLVAYLLDRGQEFVDLLLGEHERQDLNEEIDLVELGLDRLGVLCFILGLGPRGANDGNEQGETKKSAKHRFDL